MVDKLLRRSSLNNRTRLLIGLNLILLVLQYPIFINRFLTTPYLVVICILSGVLFGIDLLAGGLFLRQLYLHNYYLQQLKKYHHFTRLFTLSFSIVINLAYVAFTFGLGIFNLSIWFTTLAVYYLVLVISRFYIAVHLAQDPDHGHHNLRGYQIISYLILLIIPAFIGLIVLTLSHQTPPRVSEVQTITLATYTFYNIGSSIMRYRRSWRERNAILMADANLALIISLLSIFTLQTIMLKTYTATHDFYQDMTIIVGIAMLAIVIIVWASMQWYLYKQKRLGSN